MKIPFCVLKTVIGGLFVLVLFDGELGDNGLYDLVSLDAVDDHVHTLAVYLDLRVAVGRYHGEGVKMSPVKVS